jgi:hypothetical protein
MTPQEELLEIVRQYFQWKATFFHKEMVDACPGSLMQDIVNDHRRGVSPPSSLAATPDAPPPEPRNYPRGSIEAASLAVPGIRYVDQLCDAADAKDKAERVAEILRRLK